MKICAAIIGLSIGFYLGEGYGQLEITCAIWTGKSDLRGLSYCAGGPEHLARYILTRNDDGK